MMYLSKQMFSILCVATWIALPLCAQTSDEDTLISRDVVVEREYRPIIQSAGKLNIPPKQVDTKVEPARVEYSDYSATLSSSYNFNPLAASSIRFNQPVAPDGHLEGGIGHPLSHLDFGYRIRHKQDIRMDLFAKHDAQWGVRTWEDTRLGMNFLKNFSSMNVYFNVDGIHNFFTRYGRYYDGDNHLRKKYKDLSGDDFQHMWTVNTAVGVRSSKNEMIQYRVQTGYTAFILPNMVCEHQIRTYADVGWKGEEHAAGAHIFIQNAFYSVDEKMNIPDSAYNARHAIRIEPYYEYATKSLRIHAGVHIDMNIGRGKYLSNTDNLSFAPSPNVTVEYRIIPSWLAVYAGAEGSFGTGLFQTGMLANPYDMIEKGITTHHVCSYTPINASVGFKIRPVSTFFMDIYAHYEYMKNYVIFLSPTLDSLRSYDNTVMQHRYGDFQRWTVGAQFTYHYQDIIHILLGGNYYAWKSMGIDAPQEQWEKGVVYDRPSWDLHLRIDANINSKWSLYSDNIFGGSRNALLLDATHAKLKENIDLRLGVQYNIHRWLSCYLQLNNYLNRHNDIFYGYQSLGINGQIGVRWQF